MSLEDVVLVSTVREDIRGRTLRVDMAEITRRVEAVQAGKPVDLEPKATLVSPVFPRSEAYPSVDRKRTTKDGDVLKSKGSQEHEGAQGNISAQRGDPAGFTKSSSGEVAAMRTVEMRAATRMAKSVEEITAKQRAEEAEGGRGTEKVIPRQRSDDGARKILHAERRAGEAIPKQKVTDKVRKSAEVACRAEESVKRQRAEGREREIAGYAAIKGPAEGAVRDVPQGGIAAGWAYQGYQGYQHRQGNWW
jgi:hypothetical protein